MSTLGPSLVEENLSSYRPSSGKSQVYPLHTAAGQRSQGPALVLRVGQTCGIAHVLEPSAGLAKVGLQQAQSAPPHFLLLFTKKLPPEESHRLPPVFVVTQGRTCGHTVCFQSLSLLRSPGPLSLADAGLPQDAWRVGWR